MRTALPSYLAQDRQRALATGAVLPELTSGAALFADISGFTPLTETLTQMLGLRRGAEELTRQINQVYDALVALIERWRGSVISFSGDALTCWFDDRDGAATPRAVTAALALQEAMQGWTERPIPAGGTVRLALKVAVASGSARRFVVGDPAIQLIDTLAGSTIARMATAEHLAEQGEVVIDAASAAALGRDAIVRAWRNDPATGMPFAVLAAVAAPAVPLPWPPPAPVEPDTLRPWVLPAVAAREHAGLGTFLTELRPVVALFLRFEGIDYDIDPDAAHRLDRLVRGAQVEIQRYAGALLQLTIGDKGAYLYATFGVPVAHEDDAARAVLAALALRTCAANLSFLAPVQIGIAAGPLRCGPYGSTTRRSYSALGDAVNLAARLMQRAAPGQILADATVHRATASLIAWSALPPTTLKGKRDPVAVFAVATAPRNRIALSEPATQLPLIGRAAEVAHITTCLERALAGQGQIVLIEAEAGLGKSRLLAETIRLARQRGLTGLGGACQATGTATPYLLWEPIVRVLLDLDAANSPEQAAALAIQRVAALAPDHVAVAPLLSPLLGLPIADTSLTAALAPQDRSRALQALLVACLGAAATQARAAGGALLLVVEDAHWIDGASRAVLEDVAYALPALPVLLLIATRPTTGSERLDLAEHVHTTVLRLTELADDEAAEFIDLKLRTWLPEGVVPPPSLVARLCERAQGNPFYLDELLTYLHDEGIALDHPAALDGVALPESLHRLVVSRIDQLTTRQQATLKTASVLGRRFLASWLVRAFAELGTPETIQTDLAVLAGRDLTPLETVDPDLTYLFKHLITQEAAYANLPEATRAVLHEQFATYLERLAGDEPERVADLLAYHYGQSANDAKARAAITRAGRLAARRGAHAPARQWLLQALARTPHDDVRARWELLLDLEQVCDVLGERAAQREILVTLEELLAHWPDDLPRRGELALRRARYAELISDYGTAADQARMAVEAARVAGAHELSVAGQVRWGAALMRRADYAAARPLLEQALAEAEANDLGVLAAHALRNLGHIAYLQGDGTRAEACYRRDLACFREAGLLREQGITLGNLGNVALLRGAVPEARAAYSQALQIARPLGDRPSESRALFNLGNLAFTIGDYADAQHAFAEAEGLLAITGERWGTCLVWLNQGNIALAQARPNEAEALFLRSLELAQAIEHTEGEVAALVHLAALDAAVGTTAGQARAEEAVQRAQAMGDQENEALGRVALAALALLRSDVTAALAEAEAALQIGQAIEARQLQAVALLARGEALLAQGQAGPASNDFATAAELRAALGQQHQIPVALSGVARAALLAGDQSAARATVATIQVSLGDKPQAGLDEPILVARTIAMVLEIAGDAQAQEWHARAAAHQAAVAARLHDPVRRSSWLSRWA